MEIFIHLKDLGSILLWKKILSWNLAIRTHTSVHTHTVSTFPLFLCQLKIFELFNEIQKTTGENVKFTCVPRLTNIFSNFDLTNCFSLKK